MPSRHSPSSSSTMSTPSLTPFESHYASSSKAVSTVASSPPASSDMPDSKDEHEEEDEEEEELSVRLTRATVPPYLTSLQDEDKRKWQQLLVYIEKAALYSKMLDEQMSKAKSNYSSQQSAQQPTAPTAPVGKMPKFEVQREKSSRKPKSKGPNASTKSKSRKRVIEVSDGSDVEHDAKRAKLDETVPEEPTGAFRQPALVTGARLKEYQLEGVAWMVALFQNGLSGILADEMGLGKTLQTIAFHAYLRERTPAPFLVVCPLSVLHNWIDEFKKFAPDIPTCMYHGTPEERAHIRKHEMVVRKEHREKYWLGGSSVPRTKATPKRKQGRPPRKHKVEFDEEDEPELPPNQQTTFPVVITTYEMIIKDRVHFMNYRWGFIVVDEGHRLKNMDCKLVREIKQIPAAARMVLTGTPLQNNLAELWSLLNFVLPSIFTDLDTFQDWFNQPTAQGSIGSTHTSRVIHSLHTILRPFLLRRVKADVETGLPPKKEYVLYAPISERQRELYDAIVQGGLRALLLREQGAKKQDVIEILTSDEEDEEDKKDVDETPKKKGKQIASRTRSKYAGKEESKRRRYNLDGGGDREYWRKLQSGDLEADRQKAKEKSVQELGQEWRYKSQHAKTNEYVINEELVTASGKMMVLERLLDELFQRGHKVLLFSQFTTMLDIIEDWATEFKEWPICRIDGSTKMDDRRNEVRRFQEGGDDPDAPQLFLLSTRAGGLGLNLVAADTVIFYDQDWNPQMDIQAQDRAHRIGQTKPVLIFRLVSAHTVETKIMERATDKRKLEALVIAKGKFKSTTFTDASSTLSSSPHHVPKKVRQETMAELAASLLRLEGEKIQVVTSKGRAGVLSDGDLDMLLDRSPEVFLDRQKGWNSNTKLVGGVKGSRGVKDEKAAFAVYEAPRDEGNDALARMMGEDIVD